jgi:hypothetical protein
MRLPKMGDDRIGCDPEQPAAEIAIGPAGKRRKVRRYLQEDIGKDVLGKSAIEQSPETVLGNLRIIALLEHAEGRAVGFGPNDKLVSFCRWFRFGPLVTHDALINARNGRTLPTIRFWVLCLTE